MGQRGYAAYEEGKVTPPPDKLAKLAELFGVSTDYLLGREVTEAQLAESADELTAMGCRLAYHEVMKAIATRPRKLQEFRRLLEDFRSRLS